MNVIVKRTGDEEWQIFSKKKLAFKQVFISKEEAIDFAEFNDCQVVDDS